MKPKTILTVASVLYILMGLTAPFMFSEFNFFAYLAIAFAFCFTFLFWSFRNMPASKTLDTVLLTGFLAFFLGSLLAFYAQWSGNYMDSPAGYLEGVAWLAMALWFFFVWRANKSTG